MREKFAQTERVALQKKVKVLHELQVLQETEACSRTETPGDSTGKRHTLSSTLALRTDAT